MPATAELGLQLHQVQTHKLERSRTGLPVTRTFELDTDGQNATRQAGSDLRRQLDQVGKLQNTWDRELGIQRKRGEFANYEPIFARWRYERTLGTPLAEEFRTEEIQNIKTALRERNHSEKSELTFSINQEGKIQPAHSDEPWENIIERGRLYREEQGSQEQIREQAEVDGFHAIQADLTDPNTPIGEKRVVVSRPGIKGGPYQDNYIDIYEKAQDAATREFYINYTRFISPLDEAQTETLVRKKDPTYFEGENKPRDAWYLQKPLEIPAGEYITIDGCWGGLFKEATDAMDEAEFQQLWRLYLPAALHYIDVLTQPDFNPIEVAKAWNTVLLSTENETLRKKAEEVTVFLASNATRLNKRASEIMGKMSNRYGDEKPRVIQGGCGTSGGVIMENNSVSQFDPKRNYSGENAKNDPNLCRCGDKDPHFHCPGQGGSCGHEIIVGEGTSSCPKCGSGQVC